MRKVKSFGSPQKSGGCLPYKKLDHYDDGAKVVSATLRQLQLLDSVIRRTAHS